MQVVVLLGFIAVTALVAASGAIFKPDAWYAALKKPGWTPPNWVFPAVWTPLYLTIAMAGWLAWRSAGFAVVPFAFYAAQLALNGAWSGLFFGLRRPDLAFAELLLLWLAIAGTIAGFASLDISAALLLLPYLVWVTIAGALNLSVWRLNASRLSRA